MRIYKHVFERIIATENLFAAWDEFKRGKSRKADVGAFELRLEPNIFALRRELLGGHYRHGPYSGFYIRDPKVRHIHKATVRDRVLHHAVFRVLNPIFEPTFIPMSFSCRVGKGTHRGVRALEKMLRAESRNGTRACWALKCDVRKYFDTIDHGMLLEILGRRIKDDRAMRLLREIIDSYSAARTLFERIGVPIGNLTSQLFANAYLNEFDQFVKHKLKVKHYVRYTDDFVIVSADRDYLLRLMTPIAAFLRDELHLELHPGKVTIRQYVRGIDFLGYVLLPHHIVPRTKTKRRMFRKLEERAAQYRSGLIPEEAATASLRSYLGVLSHAAAFGLEQEIRNRFWLWMGGGKN